MRYHIHHTTTYSYDRPVTLTPHVVRLRPRCDVTQSLLNFSLEVDPTPIQIIENIDLDGNSIFYLYFSDSPLTTLTFSAISKVETHRENPFAYLLEPSAVQLPIDYPSSMWAQLQPYLSGASCNFPGGVDAIALQLAQEIWLSTGGNTISFLTELNQRIFQSCKYIVREQGEPYPPGITWNQKTGSCRDLTLLFMEVCRAMGLATRFVSGYHEGDPDWDDRHLHAWAEVYLPDAGWRGYDPTQGLAVSDRHIALVASPNSRQTIPIIGALKTGIGTASKMTYRLTIDIL